jgi:hypothetical protein
MLRKCCSRHDSEDGLLDENDLSMAGKFGKINIRASFRHLPQSDWIHPIGTPWWRITHSAISPNSATSSQH